MDTAKDFGSPLDTRLRKRFRRVDQQLQLTMENQGITLSPSKRSREMPQEDTKVTPRRTSARTSARVATARVARVLNPTPKTSAKSTPARKNPTPITPRQTKLTGMVPVVRAPVRERNARLKTPDAPLTSEETHTDTTSLGATLGQSLLIRAKKSLHGGHPETLDCRDDHIAMLSGYVRSHLDDRTPGSLYVSGPSGTGKTVCITHILKDVKGAIVINCMSLKNPQSVYQRIASELLPGGGSRGQRKGAQLRTQLEEHITSAKDMIVLVLEEMDQLGSSGQQVLYTLFEWPALKNSKIILIGVANALDLTDRLLPRLQSHVKLEPTLVHFPPFSRQEIATIITNRLKQGGAGLVIDPMAVQYCSRKVAAMRGDLRNALDVCRRAIELAEMEERGHKENVAASDLPIHVTLRHISSVMSGAADTTKKICTIPLQQKLAICTLLCLTKSGLKNPTVGKMYDTYTSICLAKKLRQETEAEFGGVVGLLDSRGVVCMMRGKSKHEPVRIRKVCLKMDEEELEHLLKDRVLMSSILEQGLGPSKC